MKIGHLKESLKKLFKAGISCRTRLSAWLVCFLPFLHPLMHLIGWKIGVLIRVAGTGWEVSLMKMPIWLLPAWHPIRTESFWRLEVPWERMGSKGLFIESNGPKLLADWTGVGARNLPFSTITSVTWLNNLLACGVEYLDGEETHAGVVFLNPDSPENLNSSWMGGTPSARYEKIQVDQSKLWVLGTKNEKSICRSINSSNEMINEFSIANMIKPRAMAITDNQVWVCGEKEVEESFEVWESFVEVFVDGKKRTKSLGKGHFISDMQASGKKFSDR